MTKEIPFLVAGAVSAFGFLAVPSLAQSAQCQLDISMPVEATTDVCAVVELSREWIEEGWSPKGDTESFSFESDLERFYDPSAGMLVLHDTNDPEMRVMHDARRYGENFETLLRQEPYLDNEWTSLEHVRVDGDTALIAFTADAVFEDDAGSKIRVPHFYSLGWRRVDVGDWRIFHEHGSSMVPGEEE